MLNIYFPFLFKLLLGLLQIMICHYLLGFCISDALVHLIRKFLRFEFGMGYAVHVIWIINF